MKLSNLSLAILSAIALAACGSSGDDNQTTDPGAGAGATKPVPKKPEPIKPQPKKDDTAKNDAAVNPTEIKVVDNIALDKDPTYASQQYLRGEKSEFDKGANKDQQASATVLSGINLDEQNPQLTNIVVATPQVVGKDGKLVTIAQYIGSESAEMPSQMKPTPSTPADEKGAALQIVNFPNALVGGYYTDTTDGWQNASATYDGSGKLTQDLAANDVYAPDQKNRSFVSDAYGAFVNPAIKDEKVNVGKGSDGILSTIYSTYVSKKKEYDKTYAAWVADGKKPTGNAFNDLSNAVAALVSISGDKLADADDASLTSGVNLPANILNTVFNGKSKNVAKKIFTDTKTVTIEVPKGVSGATKKLSLDITVPDLAQFGGDAYIFAIYDSVNSKTLFADAGNGGTLFETGWGDEVDTNDGTVKGTDADATSNNPTHGLVGVWTQSINGQNKLIARGEERHNVRTSRIFGHYYLDPGVLKTGKALRKENYNSWLEPKSIVTSYDTSNPTEPKASSYGLAVVPNTLHHVQYGRVTGEIAREKIGVTTGDVKGWAYHPQEVAAHDSDLKSSAVDFYFYRGTGATTLDQMDKLPQTEINYQGHALMYGIDNSYHGAGRDLPNAFGVGHGYALGNFVKATLDMGKKTLEGYIYNAWQQSDKAGLTEDKLVEFNGNVVGNTAVGTANLAYGSDNTEGTFKASFYGDKANELGGAVNSVTDKAVYGAKKWGGVFGASRVEKTEASDNGLSAWLVSSKQK